MKALPGVEDELSAAVAELRGDVQRLHEWLQPLHTELADVDDTAEKLETALKQVDVTIGAFHAELKDLRGRIPGIEERSEPRQGEHLVADQGDGLDVIRADARW